MSVLAIMGVGTGPAKLAIGGATNRLLHENADGFLLENSSGDLALE